MSNHLLPENFRLKMPNGRIEKVEILEDRKLDTLAAELGHGVRFLKMKGLFDGEIAGHFEAGRANLPVKWKSFEGVQIPIYGGVQKSLGREESVIAVDKRISNEPLLIYLLMHEIMHFCLDRDQTISENRINKSGRGCLNNLIVNFHNFKTGYAKKANVNITYLDKTSLKQGMDVMKIAQKNVF
jgi:hypothetical protein